MPSLRTLAMAAALAVAVVASTASAAAQSSVQSGAAGPLSTSPAPARDSRTAIPKVPPAPQVPAVRQIRTQVIVLKPNALTARKDSVCYALRTYEFDRSAAGEPAKFSGQSTCVPAKTSNALAVAAPH